jgi:hypothetical protein
MKWGVLRDQFKGVAWKRLTPHEVDPEVSNGHEFQGVGQLRELLGTESKREIPAKYILLGDDPEDTITVASTISWYDSRANQPHRSPEWRLYYPNAAGEIQARMQAGDLMVICVGTADDIAVLLARAGSSSEAQLRVLFGVTEDGSSSVEVKSFAGDQSLDFVSAMILEELALGKAALQRDSEADEIAAIATRLTTKYPDALPTSAEVSALVSVGVKNVDVLADPDHALLRWVEAEAAAFRAWEDARIARRLAGGFVDSAGEADVEGFRTFTMTLRQSRVSRAGSALQNHVARVLDAFGVKYEAQARTEKGERPDFLFPGSVEYADPTFPATQLRVLAVKFTLKERWRQILNEAVRVPEKHVLTMDGAITKSTLEGMRDSNLRVCMPQSLRESYPSAAQSEISSVRELLDGPLAPHR